MKRFLLNLIGENKITVFFNLMSSITRQLAAYIHKKQMEFVWSRKTEPRWFNHFSDQFYQLRENKNTIWMERGVYNCAVLNENSKVLEIGCGDGFNAFHFYSLRCKDIVAIDFDESALSFAKKYNSNSKIRYQFCDILKHLPDGKFNNIIWDGSIEQFTEIEIEQIINRIKNRLEEGGILSGYTAQGNSSKSLNLSHNKREFESKMDLYKLLSKFFQNVRVFDTKLNSKVSLYFKASDQKIED
jgi:SAM-dependent methyltransferase